MYLEGGENHATVIEVQEDVLGVFGGLLGNVDVVDAEYRVDGWGEALGGQAEPANVRVNRC